MREHGIRGRRRRRYRVTTQSNHAHAVANNVLSRKFDVDKPNQVFASDITYIWTIQGWLHLSVVMDLFSRRIVGWAMSERINAKLTVDAMRMALKTRKLSSEALHHSDRGSQYASAAYRKLLAHHGIECSMSRRGNCWDNAVVESFFASLKVELVHESVFVTREQARTEIFEYIELFYNRWRRHSYLGYVSPVDYENQAQSIPMAA
jgi:transposase InsO family protein